MCRAVWRATNPQTLLQDDTPSKQDVTQAHKEQEQENVNVANANVAALLKKQLLGSDQASGGTDSKKEEEATDTMAADAEKSGSNEVEAQLITPSAADAARRLKEQLFGKDDKPAATPSTDDDQKKSLPGTPLSALPLNASFFLTSINILFFD